MGFQDIADQLGLPADKLDELTWDVEICPYQRIDVPPNPPLDGLLKVMNRRGLEPKLVGILFDIFPDRPLERALIAWDVVNASLLGRDDAALLERVTQALAPIKGFAQVSAAVTRDHIADLAAAAMPGDGQASVIEDLATETPSLGALMQLTKVRKNLDEDADIAAIILAHVKRLELAHLPSLAIAFLQILYSQLAYATALELIVELALDHDIKDAIPQLTGEDDRSLMLQTYLLVRANLTVFNPITAQKVLDAVPSNIRQAPFAPLILARCEVVLMNDQCLNPETEKMVKDIVPAGVPWRYGNYVQNAAAIARFPDNAASLVDSFTTTFGNNPYLWAQAADAEPQKPDLVKLISREVRYGSHDPHVWRAVCILISDGEALGAKLDERMMAQLAGALAA